MGDADQLLYRSMSRLITRDWGTEDWGTPAPSDGEAVHLELSDGLFYEGNGFMRRNIVGVKSPLTGDIVRQGIVGGYSGLTAGKDYFLDFMTHISSLGFTTSPDKDCKARETSTYSQSQSFLGQAGKTLVWTELKVKKVGSPTYNVFLRLRNDDGSGKPGTSVLAESEHLPAADLYTSLSVSTLFRWFHIYRQSAVTYHLELCADTDDLDGSNYLVWGGVDAGGYADGQRCSQATLGGAWSADGTDDLYFVLYHVDLDIGSYFNLTATHPFDDSYAFLVVNHPIIKVGRAVSDTEIDVNLQVMPVKMLLDDWSTVISMTGTTYKTVPFGLVTPVGCEKLLVLWKINTQNAYWNIESFMRQTFTLGVNNRQRLLFKMKYSGGTAYAIPVWSGQEGTEQSLGGGAATSYVGRVTVFGA